MSAEILLLWLLARLLEIWIHREGTYHWPQADNGITACSFNTIQVHILTTNQLLIWWRSSYYPFLSFWLWNKRPHITSSFQRSFKYIYIYSILKYVNNVWNLWACHHHTQSHARPKLCLSLEYLHCNPCRTEDPPNRKKKTTIWIFRYQRSLQKWSFAVNKSNKNRHPPSSRKKKIQEQQFNPCHLKQHVFSTNCPGPLAPAACKFLALSVFHGVLRMLRGFKTFTTSLRQGRRC